MILEITKSKKKEFEGYNTSFARNIHERVDRPVFTVNDALRQLDADEHTKSNRNEIEKCMDEFFLRQ